MGTHLFLKVYYCFYVHSKVYREVFTSLSPSVVQGSLNVFFLKILGLSLGTPSGSFPSQDTPVLMLLRSDWWFRFRRFCHRAPHREQTAAGHTAIRPFIVIIPQQLQETIFQERICVFKSPKNAAC